MSAPLREPIPQICSLKASIETALKNYPTIRYAKARVLQTQAGITLARTAYLPTFDVLLQELRTTRNVIAGSIFPQTLDVIPIQSGKETSSSTFGSIFGSNVGANFSWELYDFGLRNANVMLAKADRVQSGANVHLTELDVASTAAETYLETVANKEKIRAQEATVARMKAYNLVVHTLVDKGLRPGVDASRADADLSFAKIALMGAYPPIVRIQQLNLLRIVTPVPEVDTSGVIPGAKVEFTVSTHPGERFVGTVARLGNYLEQKTRTMPVELNYWNHDNRVLPGMFCEVYWPTKRPRPSLFVPLSAVETNSTVEQFVCLVAGDNKIKWVKVKRGLTMGNLVEVFGDLKPGDIVALHGSDELTEGIEVKPHMVPREMAEKSPDTRPTYAGQAATSPYAVPDGERNAQYRRDGDKENPEPAAPAGSQPTPEQPIKTDAIKVSH